MLFFHRSSVTSFVSRGTVPPLFFPLVSSGVIRWILYPPGFSSGRPGFPYDIFSFMLCAVTAPARLRLRPPFPVSHRSSYSGFFLDTTCHYPHIYRSCSEGARSWLTFPPQVRETRTDNPLPFFLLGFDCSAAGITAGYFRSETFLPLSPPSLSPPFFFLRHPWCPKADVCGSYLFWRTSDVLLKTGLHLHILFPLPSDHAIFTDCILCSWLFPKLVNVPARGKPLRVCIVVLHFMALEGPVLVLMSVVPSLFGAPMSFPTFYPSSHSPFIVNFNPDPPCSTLVSARPSGPLDTFGLLPS